jgi:hypothetical protein
MLAIELLSNGLPSSETDLRNPQSLASNIQATLYYIVGQRGNKTYEELQHVQTLFSIAKKSSLARLISPTWEQSLTINLALSPSSSKTVLKQLKECEDVLKLFDKKTDRYEKSLFVNVLTTVFSNRKDRSVRELDVFKSLLDMLLSSTIMRQNIFDRIALTQFNEWKTIITATLVLLSFDETQKLDAKVKTCLSIIKNLSNTKADYERELFIPILSGLFASRGELDASELQMLMNFFKEVKKVPNILAANQMTVFDVWLQEIGSALGGTTGKLVYIKSLLEGATKTNNIDTLDKVLSLFTSTTPTELKTEFVKSLNHAFTQRVHVNKAKLLTLLEKVQQKKFDRDPFLSAPQLKVMKAWVAELKK